MRIGAILLFLAAGVSFRAFASAEDPIDCLRGLRLARLQFLEQLGKRPATRIYYPDDFQAGDNAELVIYFPGFNSKPDSFLSKRVELLREYARIGVPDPIFLSFTFGSYLAGLEAHGTDNPHFLPASDFWNALLEDMHLKNLTHRRISFLGNSGGAFNALQMLREVPGGMHVAKFVACALPDFTNGGFAPNPSLRPRGVSLDPEGTILRGQLEAVIAELARDVYFENLLPMAALTDHSLSRDTQILIHSARWDALGYGALNRLFAQRAQLLGYPVMLNEINGGHSQSVDLPESVRFFVRP